MFLTHKDMDTKHFCNACSIVNAEEKKLNKNGMEENNEFIW